MHHRTRTSARHEIKRRWRALASALVTTAVVGATLALSAAPAGAAIGNSSFETGTLSSWTAAPAPGGAVTTTTAALGFEPTHGKYFALVTAGQANTYTRLSQPVTVAAGETIKGWAFFKTTDYLPYNDDGAVVTLAGGSVAATVFEANVSSVGNYGSKPWTRFSYTFPIAGTYVLEARVRNLHDGVNPSYLGLDFITGGSASVPTAPSVSVTGVDNGASYEKGSVPTAGCTVSDAVDGSPVVAPVLSAVSGPLSGYGLGTRTATCSYTNSSGLSASASVSYSIVDTVAPNISGLADMEAEAATPAGTVVTYSPGVSDAVDPAPSTSCSPPSGATFALGTTTVACTATDAAGNTASASFVVLVADTTAPVLSVPVGQKVEAEGPSGSTVVFTANAADAADAAPVVSCSPASGSTFPMGTTPVTCTATDGSGNSASAGFAVQVVDTTAPALDVPENLTVEATSPQGAPAAYTVTATDVADPAPVVTCSSESGTTFALGAITVTCTATDASGNSASASFAVHVVDTTAPAIGTLADLTAEATSPVGVTVTYHPVVSDIADPAPAVACLPPSGSTFALGTTTVTCTATDASGNTASVGFGVHVVDTTAPVLTVPEDRTVEATGPDGAHVTYDANAADVVDPAPSVNCSPPSATTFALGTTTVACTATDASGNNASGGFAVHVVDTTAPVLSVPEDQTVEATGPGGAAFTYTVTAKDAVDPAPSVHCSSASGHVLPLGATQVTCTARDGAGNRESASFTVRVVDTTAPTIDGLGDLEVEGSSPAGATISYRPVVHDAVDPAPALSCSPASGATFPLGSTTVSCTAMDNAGNSVSRAFLVNVVDTTAPALSVPVDQVAEATSSEGAAVGYPAVQASDAVDVDPTVSCSPPSGSTFPLGATPVSCQATDDAGNSSTGGFRVTVSDTTAPSVTYAGNALRYAVDETVAIMCSTGDAVGVVSTTCTSITGPAWGFPLGQNTFTATSADAAGNVGAASTTFVVFVDHASLARLTTRFVTDPSIAHALSVKLKAAQAAAARGDGNGKAASLKNYRNQVSAETNKVLTAEQAAVLSSLSLAW